MQRGYALVLMAHIIPSASDIVRAPGTDGIPVGVLLLGNLLFPYTSCCGFSLILGIPNACPGCGEVYELEFSYSRSIPITLPDYALRRTVGNWLGVDPESLEISVGSCEIPS